MRIVKQCVIAVAILSFSGCATALTRTDTYLFSAAPRPYPATLIDLGLIVDSFDEIYTVPLLIFPLVDLPISLTTDTILLPYDYLFDGELVAKREERADIKFWDRVVFHKNIELLRRDYDNHIASSHAASYAQKLICHNKSINRDLVSEEMFRFLTERRFTCY